MVVLCNKKGNYSQLRLLFPTIQFALKGYPVYSKVCFTDEEFETPEENLLLVQSPAGVALDTQTGLVTFMQKIGYMAPAKITRFSKITSFGDELLVYNMYKEAICLKLANRSYLEEDLPQFSLLHITQMSLYERLNYAELVGYSSVLRSILSLLEKYYTRDSSLSRTQFQQLSEALLGFNTINFKKEYKLSGNDEYDCQLLLSYLPEHKHE